MASKSKPAQLELPRCHFVVCWPDEKCAQLCSELTEQMGHSELERHTLTETEGVEGLQKLVDSLSAKSDTDLLLLLLIGSHPAATHTRLVRLFSSRQKQLSPSFICVLDSPRSETASERLQLADVGVNMVSGSVRQSVTCVRQVLSYLHTRRHPTSQLVCPECGLSRLGGDHLRNHFPIYHISAPARIVECPICKKIVPNPGQHIHEQHVPYKGTLTAPPPQSRELFHGFSFSVIQRLKDDMFLVVQEFGSLGFWLPAGRVDPNENFQTAALREASEEVGVQIRLQGILNVSHGRYSNGDMRMEVVFFARPSSAHEDSSPKTFPDYESAGACWVTYEEILNVRVRSKSVQHWIKYVLDGGTVYPLTLLN